jgi:hypothetical protein
MQSKTDEFVAEIEAIEIGEKVPKSISLYEEFSHKDIAETVRIRRSNYEKADDRTRMKMFIDVEAEVMSFGTWLEQTKDFERDMAYHFSQSVKSLLLGLPTGLQIAYLFGVVLDKKFK